jgi:hypothetical protein
MTIQRMKIAEDTKFREYDRRRLTPAGDLHDAVTGPIGGASESL